ncbi:Wall-associated kinase family protein [Rhynchospora pubera]|uniref:Wall-associated kinase family protein n=1 Tax=Rhynchospora pubera TaxID=906938 RepID=A0AAV8FEG6_9POAL|nr:Wall-associated kinase family protein [Rhynchospora pubera]
MASLRQLQFDSFLNTSTLICLFLLTTLATSTTMNSSMSLPGCPDKCGNITIPYPFGIGTGCHRIGFNITCDLSTTSSRAFLFLGSDPLYNVELMDINITGGEARAYQKIDYVCYNEQNNTITSKTAVMDLTFSPSYLLSNRRNKFTAIGCYTLANIASIVRDTAGVRSGCVSYCGNLNGTTGDGGPCNGLGCCQTAIPAGLNYYEVNWGYNISYGWRFNPCNYAVLVEEDWYKFQVRDLSGLDFYERNENGVPVVVDWAIRDNGTCQHGVEISPNPACLSNRSSCQNISNGEGYLCQCLPGYEGSPYIPGGCIDIDECNITDKNPCSGICTNTDGNFTCSCPKGTHGNPYGKDGICIKNPENFPYPARVAISTILGVAVFLGLCLLVASHIQQKRHMKEKEEYEKYYQMMDNHLRVFSSKQIENATNNFSESNVLGAGGQGNVYKGLLENNQVVAIKKAREFEETQRGEFVNEIILLSQINHKNIVRLLGCCLEVKIPMLVYEFVPNGTLFYLLHRNKTRPISLGARLKIALESAVALDYLHSSISRSIIHGDVKSANILLDTDYTVKVSDFGASSVVPVDEIVELVHYSVGYLDPECLYTRIITKNSDVYSFGVVILELITRKQAVYLDEKGDKQPLSTGFLSKASKNKHRAMFDVEIVTNDEKVMGVLDKICDIAVQCLSPKGEDRPTMWQVVEELQKLVRFHNSLESWPHDPQKTENLLGETKLCSLSDESDSNSTKYCTSELEIDAGARR